MSSPCRNPAPNLTVQYFLNAILCFIKSSFGFAGTRSQLRSLSVTNTWAALPTVEGKVVGISNQTGADIEVRFASDPTNTVTIPTGIAVSIRVIANSNELQIQAAAGASGVNLIID